MKPRIEDLQPSDRPWRQGIVYRKFQGWYTVKTGEQLLNCRISSKLRKELVYERPKDTKAKNHQEAAGRRVLAVREIRAIDPIAIGDRVLFQEAEGGLGLIVQVLERCNRLSRQASGHKPLEQVIAANIDQVIPVFSAALPWPTWGLLDRYLAAVAEAGLPSIIAVTKMDLLAEAPDSQEAAQEAEMDDADIDDEDDEDEDEFDDDEDGGEAESIESLRAEEREAIREDLAVYERIGYPVVLTSARTGLGIEALRAALQGKVTLLLGKSGVGKTTLLNTLEPGLGLRVSEVGQISGKGRHTTTNVSMFDLAGGGAIIDTPGMREFAPWVPSGSDLADLFLEMRPYLDQCRYGEQCRHRGDPGCAVRAAVEAGEIDERRYESYLSLSS